MSELIRKIFCVLKEIKGFNAGYSSETSKDGKMIIEYKGERYAVLIEKMGKSVEEDAFDAMERLKHWF
jgi:hypothetical protein